MWIVKHFLKKILSIINLFILLIFMLLLQPEKESFQVSPENPSTTNFPGYINLYQYISHLALTYMHHLQLVFSNARDPLIM